MLQYLEALSSFDINTDPYIKRKIRDLVTATITRIPVVSINLENAPLDREITTTKS